MEECKFKSHGLQAVAINVNMILATRIWGKDLWLTAQEYILVLCLSPEQLILKGFADLLEYKPFWKQFCALGVNKIHLIYQWGMSFHFAFQQIEFIHLCCLPWIVTMGLSATVAKGDIMDHTCKFIGYRPRKFHVIRWLNTQYDVQLIIRKLENWFGEWKFAQLEWIFGEPRKTLIFCPTIALEVPIKLYFGEQHSQGRLIRTSYCCFQNCWHSCHSTTFLGCCGCKTSKNCFSLISAPIL